MPQHAMNLRAYKRHRFQVWQTIVRGCFRCAVFSVVALLATGPVQGAFHFWSIRELYTDASGDLQFIELFTTFDSQQFVGGQSITVNNVGNTMSHTFTIPSHLPGDSANHAFLIGTMGLQAAGSPTPNFIMPNDFLFLGGGTITFFGTPSIVTYSALPTDGTQSRLVNGANSVNSPQNFAGQVDLVVVPEPTAPALFGVGILGIVFAVRRRHP